MLPNEVTRQQVMEIFFEIYLDIFSEYGEVLISSEVLEAAAYIYYENKFENSFRYKLKIVKSIIKASKMLRYIHLQDLVRIGKVVRGTSSSWIQDVVEGDYIHIDLIGVKEVYRGRGKGSQFIKYVLREADKQRLPVTLETQNEDNLRLYSKMGFAIVEVFEYEGLTQYCMMYKNNK